MSAVKLFSAFQTVANWFKCDVHFLRRKVLFMSALACKLKSVFAVGKCDLYWGRKEEEEEERGRKRTKRRDSSSGRVNLGIFGNARTLRGRVIQAAALGFALCALMRAGKSRNILLMSLNLNQPHRRRCR